MKNKYLELFTEESWEAFCKTNISLLKLQQFISEYNIDYSASTLTRILCLCKELSYEEWCSFREATKDDVLNKEFQEFIKSNPHNICECCKLYGKKYKINPYSLHTCYYVNYKKVNKLFFIKSIDTNNKKIYNCKTKMIKK
jgi:hypothetical protein